MPPRVLSTGLLAGIAMNVAYEAALAVWLVAIATPLLGTANASLVPWRVTILTLVLALSIMLPLSELIWRRLGKP